MGFSVVADDVRNLAQRCAQAAKDTHLLIEDCIAKSREGKAKVDQTAEAIREIAGKSMEIRVLADTADRSTQEQTQGIAQIARAISQMEQVTQTTAASAEESAAAAEQLNAQAATMMGLSQQLKQLVDGVALSSYEKF